MKAELQALLNSRCRQTVLRGAVLLGVCAVVAVVLVLLAGNSRSKALAGNQAEQDVVADAGQSLAARADLETELPRLVAATSRLRGAGFANAADRVAWVDAAARTLERLHPIAYNIEARVAQSQSATDALLQRYQQEGIDPPVLERNDLLLDIQGLHEDELAAAIEQISAQGGGIVRPERCKITRRADGVGLDAECTLARYRLRQAGAEPTS